jgi:LysR family transcriptional regulator, carnitine catabolism transcriptional activator
MRCFIDAHPGVEVELEDVQPSDFVETLLRARVDLGIGTLEGSRVSGLREEVFQRDTLSAVGLATVAFPSGPSMTWKQLAEMRLITTRSGYGFRRHITTAAEAAGVTLHFGHEVSLLTTAVALAASGLGVAVVPSSLVGFGGHPDLVARKLVRPAVERNTAVVFSSDRSLSPAARAFADLALRA